MALSSSGSCRTKPRGLHAKDHRDCTAPVYRQGGDHADEFQNDGRYGALRCGGNGTARLRATRGAAARTSSSAGSKWPDRADPAGGRCASSATLSSAVRICRWSAAGIPLRAAGRLRPACVLPAARYRLPRLLFWSAILRMAQAVVRHARIATTCELHRWANASRYRLGATTTAGRIARPIALAADP